jgi:hypothetical protein
VAELQEGQAQISAEPPSDLGKTKVFGFFATSFAKIDYSRKDSALKLVIPLGGNSSFLLTSLNVYLANQITQHLKFLAELRFTYQPLGTEISREAYYVLPAGSKMNLGTQYERTDTTVRDPSSIQQSDSELRAAFRKRVLKMSEEKERGFWEDEKVKKGIEPPPEVPATLKAVFAKSGSVSYVFRKDFKEGTAKILATFPE